MSCFLKGISSHCVQVARASEATTSSIYIIVSEFVSRVMAMSLIGKLSWTRAMSRNSRASSSPAHNSHGYRRSDRARAKRCPGWQHRAEKGRHDNVRQRQPRHATFCRLKSRIEKDCLNWKMSHFTRRHFSANMNHHILVNEGPLR